MNKSILATFVLVSTFTLAACSGPLSSSKSGGKVADFSSDDNLNAPTPTPYADKFANSPVNFTQTEKLNQEFTVNYKTVSPDGSGKAVFKAISFKNVPDVGGQVPDSGKKLYLLQLAVKGFSANKGEPSTFNEIGDNPSPQFVMVDKSKNMSYVEETFFSDTYTATNKLFELSKLTLDGDQWVTTAIAFQVDASLSPHLAFRFINTQNQVEFYDISTQ